MADISDYVSIIQNATRGEDVRDAIVNSLKHIFSSAKNSNKLGGKSADEYAKYSDLKPFAYDLVPTKDSNSVVIGSGIYSYFGDGKNPSEASSESVTGMIQKLYDNTEDIAKAINEKGVPWTIGNSILEYGNAIRNIYKYKMLQTTITKNGTYETKKDELWNRIVVNVKPTVDTSLHVTQNGKYEAAEGKAFSPVIVDVPMGTDFEYNPSTHIGKIGCIFFNGENTESQTDSKFNELLGDDMSLDEIFKVLNSENSSTNDIFKNMLDAGYDENSIISVFMKNGISSDKITSMLKDRGTNPTKIFDGLFNSSSLKSDVNGVISSLDSGGKFNVEQIADAIKNSNIVKNDKYALDDIKYELETDPKQFSTFSSSDLLKLLDEG